MAKDGEPDVAFTPVATLLGDDDGEGELFVIPAYCVGCKTLIHEGRCADCQERDRKAAMKRKREQKKKEEPEMKVGRQWTYLEAEAADVERRKKIEEQTRTKQIKIGSYEKPFRSLRLAFLNPFERMVVTTVEGPGPSIWQRFKEWVVE